MNTSVIGHLGAARHPQAEAHAGRAAYRSFGSASLEQAPAGTAALRADVRSDANERITKLAVMRAALIVGAVAAVVVALRAASGAGQAAEPELAVLLRGMAAIKGLLALAAASVVWWRLGQPVSSRVAAAYVSCICVLFASTVLIWQLAFILAAAVLFHAAGLVGLVIALREGRQLLRFGWRTPNPSIERTGRFQAPSATGLNQ
jgi:hypothetical protein